MPFTPAEIFLGIIVPAVIAGIILLVAWQPWRKDRASKGAWGAPLAIGLAYLISFIGMRTGHRPPPFPPADGSEWTFYVVAGFTLLGIIESFLPIPFWLAAAIGPGAWLLLEPLGPEAMQGFSPSRWTEITMVAAFFEYVLMEPVARRAKGPGFILAMTVVAFGTFLILTMSNSLSIAKPVASLPAALGAAVIVAVWKRDGQLGRGGMSLFLGIVILSLLNNRLYTGGEGITTLNAVLILGSLPLTWLAEIKPLRTKRPWLRALVRITVVLIPVAVAVVLAGMKFQKENEDTGAGGESLASPVQTQILV